MRQRFLDDDIKVTLITSVDDLDSHCDGFIFLSALRSYTNIIAASDMNRIGFEYTHKIAQSFSSPKSEGVLILVQDTGGYYGFDSGCDPIKTPLGGLAGLAKTANQEWASAVVRSIDLDAGYRDSGILADILYEEIQYGKGLEVGLPENERITIECIDADIEAKIQNLGHVHSESVILASGGARGVTAACLIELSKKTCASFALLGRSPLIDEPDYLASAKSDAEIKKAALENAKKEGKTLALKDLGKLSKDIQRSREIRETLSAFEKNNSKAKYYVSDVTDVEKLIATCDQVRRDFGSITALIHGAGVLADKAIKDKKVEDFDWVFRTKVDGFFALSAATAADPLETICIFSSVAGRFGNVGQADYAMANEVLNKIAWKENKQRPDCVVKSLAWGPWGGGMVTASLQKMFEARGISVIDIDAGAKQFVDEILVQPDQNVEVVLGAGLAKKKAEKLTVARKTISITQSPYLRDHSVKSTVVLPMVFGIEWILEHCAQHYSVETNCIELEKLDVIKGIHLSEKGPLNLELKSVGKNKTLDVELHAKSLSYRTTASVRKTPAKRMKVPKFSVWDGQIYDGNILFHGPAFHFLDHMSRPDGDVIIANIAEAKNWTANYRADVQGLDAALQIGVIASNAKTNGYVVPTSIERLRIYSYSKAETVVATLVSHDKIAATYDFDLLDDTQTVTATLSGCRFQVYAQSKTTKSQ